MPNYFYTAKTVDGQTKTGNIIAEDSHKVAQILKEEGLILVKTVLPDENGKNFLKIFDVLSTQTKKKKLKSSLLDIKEKINKGQTLSEALTSYPNIFSELFVSMVKIGEESGTLEEVFKTLALQMEKEHELKSKIQGAMIYPSIILLTMLGVGIIIMTVVLPRLDTFFSSLSADLPFYTKFIIGLGKFSQKNWMLFVISPVVLVFAFMAMIKTKKGKRVLDTILIKMPFFSLLVKESNCAFLIRALSSLIASGVPIVKSLEISSKIVGNFYFRQAVDTAAEKVKKGENLSGALREYQNIFPFGTIEMIEVGEETGKTSVILKKLAEFYEQEVSDAAEKLSAAIEPIMIVILGVAVGIFAFSIIEPMYSVLGTIG